MAAIQVGLNDIHKGIDEVRDAVSKHLAARRAAMIAMVGEPEQGT